MDSNADRIYIDDIAVRIGRAAHTVRQWVRRPDFPAALAPGLEGGRNKLYWTEDQVQGLRAYAAERESLRGDFGRTAARQSA